MNNRRNFFAVALMAIVAFLNINTAVAAETATEFVERSSTELTGIIEGAQSYYKKDPERLYTEMGAMLDRVIDFKGIAKGVMGKKNYGAASDKQKEAFAKVFRKSLIKSYSQSLAGFGRLKVNVLSEKGSNDSKKTVDMLVKSLEDGTKVSVRYSMAAKKPGQWVVRNMTIEGVNLGRTYRSQFSSSMSQKAGDMDAVISQWVETEAKKE